MKQVTKKSISLFLAVLMVLSLFVNALAVDDIKATPHEKMSHQRLNMI